MSSPNPCAVSKRNALRGLLSALSLVAAGCSDNQGTGELQVADRSFEVYRDQVFPVLMRDCAFHMCHGAEQRFFRLWGSARARLNPETRALAEVLPEEIALSYTRTLSMINARDPGSSLLLRKPLTPAAGGAGHFGVDSLDRDVFQSTQDPDYLVLAQWVFGGAVP
jgi:hypothetical protein